MADLSRWKIGEEFKLKITIDCDTGGCAKQFCYCAEIFVVRSGRSAIVYLPKYFIRREKFNFQCFLRLSNAQKAFNVQLKKTL